MKRSGKWATAMFLLVFLSSVTCLGQTYLPGPLPVGNFYYNYNGSSYLAGSSVTFAAESASLGDEDIYVSGCDQFPVYDYLETNTPRWAASHGSFPYGNRGLMVTWVAPNSEITSISLHIYVDDLPWYANDIVIYPTRTVTIGTIVPYIDAVSFTDYSSNEHDIYMIYDPVYTWDGTNEPASYTQNTYENVIGDFGHPTLLSEAENVYVDVQGGLGYVSDLTVQISAGGSATYGTSHHVSTQCLPNEINVHSHTLNWRYKAPDGSNTWINMQDNPTEHTLYTVFGAPKVSYGYYTKSNLIEAVGKATGESTEAEIASAANDNVASGVYSGCICASGFQVNFDAAMGRYPASAPKGMCCCRAEGLDCVLNVLGIGPYTHDYVNECPEPNPTGDVSLSYCAICDRDLVRNYWDGTPSNGFWNNWEGVVKAGGTGSTCYARLPAKWAWMKGPTVRWTPRLRPTAGITGHSQTATHSTSPTNAPTNDILGAFTVTTTHTGA